jgi:hypothetical protein
MDATISLAAHALVRVAGLPVGALALLACPRSKDLLERLDACEQRLEAERGPLCAMLHAAVGRALDREVRRALLLLKRAVFNDTPPDHRWDAARRAAGPACGARLNEELTAWALSATRRCGLISDAEAVIATELDERLRTFRVAWGSPAFLTGLLVAQPDVLEPLLELLDGTVRLPPKRARHLQITALAYWMRMASKTSPFSTFTATSIAALGQETARPEAGPAQGTVASFRLNTAVLETVASLAASHPDLADDAALRLNPTALDDGRGRLLLIRRVRGGGAHVGPSPVEERFAEVRVTAPVERALATVREQEQSPGALASALWRGVAEPTEAMWRTLVDRLTAAGVLEATIPFGADRPDAARHLASALRSRGGARGRELAATLDKIDASLATLASCAPRGQAAILREIARAVDSLHVSLGASPPPRSQGLVFEDVYLAGDTSLPASEFEPFREDLGRVAGVLPLFNPLAVLRLLASEYLVGALHDKPTPFVRFLRDFYRDVYEPLASAPRPEGNPTALPAGVRASPSCERLFAVRDELTAAIAATVRAAPGRVALLPRELFDRFGERARAFHAPGVPLSVAHFVQRDATAAAPQLVLNQVTQGYGSCFARYCDARVPGGLGLARAVARTLADAPLRGEWVEIGATFGFDGQVHEPLTPRFIRYPGETVCRAGRAEVPWAALRVERDDRGAVVLREGQAGPRLVPLLLGSLAPIFQPIACRVLGALGASLLPEFSILDLLDAGAPASSVRHYPRVVCGGVVLMRETWRATAPAPASASRGEVSRVRAFRSWARDLGLPSRAFVVPQRLSEWLRGGGGPRRLRSSYKPFFVDFDSPLSLKLFDRYATAEGVTLSITEALPLIDPTAPGADERSVTELVVETWSRGHP